MTDRDEATKEGVWGVASRAAEPRRPPRRRLLRAWAAASVVYVAAAAALSAGPVSSAIHESRTRVAVTAASARTPAPAGPIPEAPPSPAMRIGQAVGAEALLLAGPPLLALWLGWDVWFALVGFFPALHGATPPRPPAGEA